MNTGIVLDIFRCSLHDGPGIRTTVFLKGCPLACVWCHNPESQALKPVLLLNPDRCTHCGLCAKACPHGFHLVSAADHTIARRECSGCGSCVQACPTGALEIRGKSMTVEQILAEALKDADYYRDTGGGLTISGGEPMQQWQFTLALAQAAKAAGIHVAIETCGLAPADRYRALLPFVDLFLFDYKDTDSARHARLTGVPNHLILENLAMLHAAGANITLRCPMAAGLNDTDDHFAAIAAMPQRFPHLLGIEIMSYHNMGNEKARRTGVPVRLDIPTTDALQKQNWRDRLDAHGCNAIIN